jgi:hypothetical protein
MKISNLVHNLFIVSLTKIEWSAMKTIGSEQTRVWIKRINSIKISYQIGSSNIWEKLVLCDEGSVGELNSSKKKRATPHQKETQEMALKPSKKIEKSKTPKGWGIM